MSEGYKETSLGRLPNNWQVSKIEEIADVRGGKRLPKGESLNEKKTNHPYIRVADMFFGGVDLKKILYVPEHVFPSIKSYTIGKDDLFISVAGTLGIVGEVPVELDGANLTENADKLTNIKINKSFLLQVLLSPIIQNAVQKEQTNNAQPKLALSRIRTFEIPNPPLPEQQKIAEILSTVDAKIEVIDQQITETQELKKGMMQQLLSGKLSVIEKRMLRPDELKDSALGKIPKGWEVVTIGNVLKIKHGYAFLGAQFSSEPNNNVLLTPGNFKPEGGIKFNWEKQKYYKGEIPQDYVLTEGDLVLALTDLTQSCIILGAPAIIPNSKYQYLHNQRLGLVQLLESSKLTNDFLFHFFNFTTYRNYLKNNATGTTVSHTSPAVIYKMKMAIPSVFEQQKITNILGLCDDKLQVLSEKKVHYQELKQGLMQQLLTGKLRVSNATHQFIG